MEAEKLVETLREHGLVISTAESCTGGLLAKSITDIPGSSDVFELGMVTYSNRIKTEFLGVPEKVLETVGAVSKETAEAMAAGIVKASGADIGVGITGIAGPGGGSEEKPVGTVWVSIFYKAKSEKMTECLHLSGNREAVREQTVKTVISRLISCINENY